MPTEVASQNKVSVKGRVLVCNILSCQVLLQVPVFEMGVDAKPAEIAKQGLAKACAEDYDAIIVDSSDPVGPAEVLFQKVSLSNVESLPSLCLLVAKHVPLLCGSFT